MLIDRIIRISIIFCLTLLSIRVQAQNKQKESKILDKIFELKEVRQRAEYIKLASKGERHLSAIIYSKPSKDEPYYWVKVWEDNGDSYVSHFHFFVYPDPFEIKYYNVAEDTAISLEEWRKQLDMKNISNGDPK